MVCYIGTQQVPLAQGIQERDLKHICTDVGRMPMYVLHLYAVLKLPYPLAQEEKCYILLTK